MAVKLINGDIADGIVLLSDNNSLRADNTLKESINQLINDWKNSKFELQDRLIIAAIRKLKILIKTSETT
ncbi:putative conjugative transfer protein TraI [Orientia tsutsugamushi str. Gilliam]|uniref:Putative conjugative transfer protein TraI n=1 Tax=Orientia tsutsugamushi str. Gilliam TaxID=1359184 RepID=A0A0F3M5Y3_ORITS|nr:putative conjugative transfer protein TraI [Orientia tsutsugamushi str. Gilliam]